MVVFNGWYAGGGGFGIITQSMGETEQDFCPNFIRPFLENADRKSRIDGSREQQWGRGTDAHKLMSIVNN